MANEPTTTPRAATKPAATPHPVPAEKADGTEILTLEGVSPAERETLARAFSVAAGAQCGCCIPQASGQRRSGRCSAP